MSLEAIQFLTQTEEKARHMKAEAAAAAKKRIADARMDGETMLEEALKKAEAELDAISAALAEEAEKNALELEQRNRDLRLQMEAAAKDKMTEAVDLIVERIVTG